MAVKMRLKRMGQKKAPFTELLWQTQDLQEMVSLSRKLVTMIQQRSQV